MKPRTASGVICTMAQAKKARSRYLRPRSGTSSHFQGRKLRPNAQRPKRASRSETKPTGQSHEQKLLRATRAMTTKTRKSTVAAGWTTLRLPW